MPTLKIDKSDIVIPAQAGILGRSARRIPAFAGMTE